MFARGLSVSEVAAALDVTKSTVCYHARVLDRHPEKKFARRYDWDEIQSYYDRGHSITECVKEFGFSKVTWHEAVRRGIVTSRPAAARIETYLVSGKKVNRYHLKRRLLGEGLKEERCEECGIAEWRARPLSLALHHVNGDGCDNRLENLTLLCPNCHSQTDNFAGRNARRRPNGLPEGAVPCRELHWYRLPVRGVAV